ncbi:L-threonine 3-dehydrogenase [Chthonomonas calidirosea]|uniref:L-threonine 3-dehydrogenase n=1 Tax=Chthonomonas calidirosea (strain DSM 23976 / ICMP 18418 / T49) TaxID=1303518 RepID=S0EYV4_CHTCT|nr:L-threonine 3-dehydrogenase [Chthonomonas calidirosea]CCW35731.1 L-threonine 3-dehydrogenase [Chthonomonas calidirosea T49]CEK19406.1 L-threonine 3-dehydrogenase [Chthonomonas calidirosea]
MKAIVKATAGPGASLVEVPEPQLTAPNQVKIRVLATSICGTDYHIYSWDAWSAHRVRPPRIMGHEFAGEVIEVGSEVTELKVGDYVSGESHLVCGKCLQCRLNQRHVCTNTRILGVDVDGCFAPYVVVPEGNLWKTDTSVPPHLACVQDPLGNAVHATLVEEVVGRTVAVLGCGPIGIFAVAVARAAGAATIYATDTHDYRLELAKTLGADAVMNVTRTNVEDFINRQTDGQGVDVALEMSGAPSAIQQAFRICRRGGRVSLMGIPTKPVELDLAEEMIFKGLTVYGIVGRRLYETWNTMQSLLASGRLNIEPAITHQLSITEFDKGMALMREGLCGKVVFLME